MSRWSRGRALPLAAAVLAVWSGVRGEAQPPLDAREVRHLVTFRFLPGQLDAALDLYGRHLIPLYREVEAMRTVRVFAEVESPEPLDLMVVTHYDGMAGVDRANQALSRVAPDRVPVAQLYRQIADLSLGHTDQFVELLSPPSAGQAPDQSLEVLEFLRISPGMGSAFERTVLASVHPWEQEPGMRDLLLRSETSRFLVADGWDYLRAYAVRNLAAWQAYTTARAKHSATVTVNRFVEARKTMILREMPDLRVR